MIRQISKKILNNNAAATRKHEKLKPSLINKLSVNKQDHLILV